MPAVRQGQQTQQKTIVSQAMRTSLDILQMPVLELREHILDEALSNPLIHVDDTDSVSAPESQALSSLPQAENDAFIQSVYRGDAFEGIRSPGSRHTSSVSDSAEKRNEEYAPRTPDGEDFTQQLLEQLSGFRGRRREAILACRYLILNLNDRGYLEEDPQDLLSNAPFPELSALAADYADEALSILQSLTPAGVGARSLSECLELQLMRMKDPDPRELKAVREGLPYIAAKDISGLSALLECSRKQACALISHIQTLCPIPSQGYAGNEPIFYQIPEAAVTVSEGQLTVLFNRRLLPRITYDEKIASLLKDTDDPVSREWLAQNSKSAHSLIRHVTARENTLAALIELIVRYQVDYFLGNGALKPMTMQDAADRLEVNVSTISRAVHEKSIVVMGRPLWLRSLFSNALPSSGGPVSSMSVKTLIRQLIAEEDPAKPLTDDDLRLILAGREIRISRRTVAKYRTEMGIPGSVTRAATP